MLDGYCEACLRVDTELTDGLCERCQERVKAVADEVKRIHESLNYSGANLAFIEENTLALDRSNRAAEGG